MASASKMLVPQIVGERHYRVAVAVRKCLAEYEELKDIIAMLGFDELPERDQQTVLTARKLERFLTQPFHTTYQFTGMEGRSVDLQKTIEGCERILAGEFNYLSENDFFMVGDIDEVIAKTKDKKENYEKSLKESA